jgi:hypothetical protein
MRLRVGLGVVLAALLCALLVISTYLVFLGVGPNECKMTFMWPGYSKIDLPK